MRGRITRTAVLALALAPCAARAQESLDLQGVVARALGANPDYLAVAEREAELEAQIREAWAEAWPQLAANSFWNRSRDPSLLNSPDFEDIIEQFPDFRPSAQRLFGVNVELSQPLFTWGQIGSGIRLAEQVALAAGAQSDTAALDTALEAAGAYFEWLAAEEGLATIDAQRRARREALDVVEARFDLGDATRLEMLQADAALAEVEPVVAAAEGRVAVAESALRSILDMGPDVELELVPPRGELPEVPARAALVDAAWQARPELVDLDRQHEALGLQERVVRADGRPRVDLTGAYGRTVRELDNLDDPLFADWRVGVALRWEFFDGGRRAGQRAGIASQRRQVELSTDAMRNRILLEIEQAWSGYRTARNRMKATERAATAAREAARVAAESYHEGVALQADWLGAQERETQAEVDRVEAYYEAWLQATRLARAMGARPDRLERLAELRTENRE